MKKEEIDALIDSVGLDAIVQHPKIVEALRPLMIDCARVAVRSVEVLDDAIIEASKSKWLTRKQAMEKLNVSSPTLQKMVHDGVIRVSTTQKNAHRRYLLADVMLYINGGDKVS